MGSSLMARAKQHMSSLLLYLLNTYEIWSDPEIYEKEREREKKRSAAFKNNQKTKDWL